MRVAVVGAGVGGLAAAIRLSAAGHEVVVFERNDRFGGKLASFEREGFRFETGPSLLTLPHVFEELLALAGQPLDDLVALDPACSYRFTDGSGFRTRASLDDTVGEVEAMAPGSGAAWRTFHDRGRRIWDVSQRTFFAGPMESPGRLIGRMRSPTDLLGIDPLPTLAGRAARSFRDPRLRQWAARYATYAGSSPYRAPATLACIPFIEQAYGCWYVRGGLPVLARRLADAAVRLGASIRTGVDVTRLRTSSGRITGVELAPTGAKIAGDTITDPDVTTDPDVIAVDVVVSDADARHLYTDLLPDRARLRRVGRAGRSSSGFVMLLAVEGSTPGLTHHQVAFSADYRREFAQIFDEGGPPDDPTVYACVSSVTDPSMAPAGCENWFVLVNVPPGPGVDWGQESARYQDRVLDVMASRGWDLRTRTRWCEVITPADIEARYRAPGGAIYGTSSNSRRSAFLRAANRGPVEGLYLVGGSAHPGGGLPLVALGARIVAEMIEADRARTA